MKMNNTNNNKQLKLSVKSISQRVQSIWEVCKEEVVPGVFYPVALRGST